MKLRWKLLALVMLAGLSIHWAVAQASKPSTPEQEIRSAVEAFSTAFNKADHAAFMSFWAEDADYVDDTGVTHKGKSAIAAMMKKNAPQLKGSKMKIDITSLRFPRPEVALEEGTVTLTSGEGVDATSNYFTVWVKEGGRWLMSSVRDQPAPVPSNADNEPLKQLAWMIGDWTNEGDGVTVNLSCQWALDKNFMTYTYDISRPTGAKTKVVQWVGFDPATSQLRSWVFDSDGGNGQASWERNGNVWTIHAEGVLSDGRRGSSTNAIAFLDDGHFAWSSRNREIDSSPVPDTEVKFSRKQVVKTGSIPGAK